MKRFLFLIFLFLTACSSVKIVKLSVGESADVPLEHPKLNVAFLDTQIYEGERIGLFRLNQDVILWISEGQTIVKDNVTVHIEQITDKEARVRVIIGP